MKCQSSDPDRGEGESQQTLLCQTYRKDILNTVASKLLYIYNTRVNIS